MATQNWRFGDLNISNGIWIESEVFQNGSVEWRGRTTTSGLTELFLDGTVSSNGSLRLPIALDAAVNFHVIAMCMDEDTGDSKGWTGVGTIKNVTGGSPTTTDYLFNIETTIQDNILNGVRISIVANDTNDTIRVQAFGLPATNLRWFVRMEYTKITMA